MDGKPSHLDQVSTNNLLFHFSSFICIYSFVWEARSLVKGLRMHVRGLSTVNPHMYSSILINNPSRYAIFQTITRVQLLLY
jgi:hypothetical protein